MHNLFELNLDILETNLINILLLIGILLYVNQVSFSNTLNERKNEIQKSIEKTEKDILLSSKFSDKIEENLKLNLFYLHEWKSKYESQKKEVIKVQYSQIQEKLKQIFSATENLLESFEKKSLANLEKYLILFVVGKLLRKFFFLSKDKKSKIINKIILNLEEQF